MYQRLTLVVEVGIIFNPFIVWLFSTDIALTGKPLVFNCA